MRGTIFLACLVTLMGIQVICTILRSAHTKTSPKNRLILFSWAKHSARVYSRAELRILLSFADGCLLYESDFKPSSEDFVYHPCNLNNCCRVFLARNLR